MLNAENRVKLRHAAMPFHNELTLSRLVVNGRVTGALFTLRAMESLIMLVLCFRSGSSW
jgi:hypothetical protein